MRVFNNDSTVVDFNDLKVGKFYTIKKGENLHCQLVEKNDTVCVFKHLMYADGLSIGTTAKNIVVDTVFNVLSASIKSGVRNIFYSFGWDYDQKINILY